MFLSLNALGGDSANTTAIPPRKQRSIVKFKGESYLDSANALNIELSDMEIQSINSAQAWDMNTIFNADFQSTLEAGNLINSGLPITHWRIYRRAENESLFTLLAEVPIESAYSVYTDFKAKNRVNYFYEVRPVSNGTEGSPIAGVSMADFYGWVLTSSDGTISYTFDLNIESDNIQTVIDMKEFENFTQYNSVSFGNRLFDKGSLSTIPGTLNVNGLLDQSADYLQTLRAFINNKEPKILRNSKGKIWEVVTYDYSEKFVDDNIIEQPTQVKFSWTQIGSGA